MDGKAKWLMGQVLGSLLLVPACDKPRASVVPLQMPPPPVCPIQTPDAAAKAVDRMREAILAELALQPGMQAGDIGTGGGWFTVRVARAVGKSGRVFGTDIDAATLEGLRNAPALGEDAAPIRLTQVTAERETGLDDLPANSLDLLLMIDSLCFDSRVPQATNIAYLQRFLRLLKPGGRLVHHMDCTCRTRVADVEALFAAAGFALPNGRKTLRCEAVSAQACPTAEAQERARFLGVFRKAR